MVRSRLPLILLLTATAAAISFLVFSSGFTRSFGTSLSMLAIGFALGLLMRSVGTSANRETNFPRALHFPPGLLDAAINEMREGLLVIDSEMQVLAFNRAARDLLSNFDPATSSRRLTELT